jgi:DNA-binding transcriptional regulator YiaG
MDNKYRTLRKSTGLKMSAFAWLYNIPYRTLQGWELGKYEPPQYVYDLLKRVVDEDFGRNYEKTMEHIR